MKALVVGVLGCFLVAPSTALADQSQTASRADRVVRVTTLGDLRGELSPGDFISVVQTTGVSVRGRLRRFGDTDLEIQAETRQAPGQKKRLLDVTIPLGAVQSLERNRDSSQNGALIGAGIGTGVWLAAFIHAAAIDANEMDEWGSGYLAAAPVFAGIGALVGWAIDSAHSKPHVRFDARSTGTVTIRAVPLLSRGPGMAMVVSF